MTQPDHDVIRGGAELVSARSGKWLTPRDIDTGVVVLIHGFTSHGLYMKDLADFVEGHGFCAAILNYDSYRGIDRAAEDLESRLRILETPLRSYGFSLVAHSMGGLVARHYARHMKPSLRSALKGIVLLGTPNRGTMVGKKWISFMLDWADGLTLPNPYLRHPLCRSTKQLTLSDSEKLIETLNEHDQRDPLLIPILSVSGGLRFLELGIGIGRTRNRALQRLIGEAVNDGLVGESSADLTRIVEPRSTPVQHRNDYSDYMNTNHTYLTRNQQVAGIVVSWLVETARLATK